jgi:hypothetical protein
MGAGPKTWVHGSTTDKDLEAFSEAQDEIVSPWASGPPATPAHIDGWW